MVSKSPASRVKSAARYCQGGRNGHTLVDHQALYPPTRPELISRPRLIERLNAGLHRKLTLISAPAGFGKTTLLSEWINQSPIPNTQSPKFAWLSLDEADNDPARFLAYFRRPADY
jgi:LuxR family maltose regulon positive regulatory protein